MKIKVNGATQQIEAGLSIADLLIRSKVEQPDMVSVQLNGEFVQRDRYAATTLKDNDEVDFLYFMGGGA
jgi:sulfur carrier protein